MLGTFNKLFRDKLYTYRREVRFLVPYSAEIKVVVCLNPIFLTAVITTISG